METMYIDTSDGRLHSVFHQSLSSTDMGVVICPPPFGLEYTNSYKALSSLSSQVASSGVHVIRFDYFGCGNSEGELIEASIERWEDDILTITNEMRNALDVKIIFYIGLRLGANLIHQAIERKKIDNARVVYIAPITNIDSRHFKTICRRADIKYNARQRSYHFEGDIMSESLFLSIAKVHKVLEKPSKALCVLECSQKSLLKNMISSHDKHNYTHIPLISGEFWKRSMTVYDQSVVPRSEYNHIINWMTRNER